MRNNKKLSSHFPYKRGEMGSREESGSWIICTLRVTFHFHLIYSIQDQHGAHHAWHVKISPGIWFVSEREKIVFIKKIQFVSLDYFRCVHSLSRHTCSHHRFDYLVMHYFIWPNVFAPPLRLPSQALLYMAIRNQPTR